MLLIGSRAALIHFPEFRVPLDWDLVGDDLEIARLEGILPRVAGAEREAKAVFYYDGAAVEVANASRDPYWKQVVEAFSGEAMVDDPLLGSLSVAPADYLLITKQCGLAYATPHWHKNLEDLYFLRDRVPVVSERVASLFPATLEFASRILEESNSRMVRRRTCEPGSRPLGGAAVHRTLHQRTALMKTPAVDQPGAWEAFPSLPSSERRLAMQRVLAEEAMVLAAENFLQSGGRDLKVEYQFVIGAMRELSTGSLPIGWRYFCINHFREILDLVPEGFLAQLADLVDGPTLFPYGVDHGLRCDAGSRAPLCPSASGAQWLPRVLVGEACSERRMESVGTCSPLPRLVSK